MKHLIIEWSAQDSGKVKFSFEDLGLTESEFKSMNEQGKMKVIQEALDSLPEEVNKFMDNYIVE